MKVTELQASPSTSTFGRREVLETIRTLLLGVPHIQHSDPHPAPGPPAALLYTSPSPPMDDDLLSLISGTGTSSSYSCSAGQQKVAKTVAKTTPNHQQLNDIKTIAKKLFELNYAEVTAYNKAAEEDIDTSLSEALPKFSFSAKTWCEIDYVCGSEVHGSTQFQEMQLDLSCSSSHKH